MKVPGLLAVFVALLLVVQFISPFNGTALLFLPVGSALACFALAVILGIVRGPAAVRWAMLLWLASFGFLVLSILALAMTPGSTGWRTDTTVPVVLFALSVAFLILAITQGIRAARAEKPASGSRSRVPA
jgi:hypothetical protein